MAEMYNWDKSLTKEKSRRNAQNPSFSSSLLDEIYRSIDGTDENYGEFKLRKQKVAKKQSGGGGGSGRVKSNSAVEDEEIASFRRACLVDKWMEMKENEKVSSRRGPPSLPEFDWRSALDNDPMFFSSGSSSSDSSFGWYSSEAEPAKPKPSCFGPFNKPKQVKTSVSEKKQNGFRLSDDDQTNKTDDSGLIRSKTRALKIYTSLKKVKQPISPGGRLTSFLNTLFTNGHAKKPKNPTFEDQTQSRPERKSKSTNVSTCTSATSFSRSCLSKNSPRSRDRISNGIRRTVRFYPESVVVSENSRPKKVHEERNYEKVPPRRYDDKKYDFEDEEEDDDMASDSSSDLFELDHLTIFKNKQYCEDLPVYETTHLGTNRAIASGLIY